MTKDYTNAHRFTSSVLQAIIHDARAFFTKTPVSSFPPDEKFEGGGVYALYYKGNFKLYKAISLTTIKEESLPIYVGKAVPAGWRTARINTTSRTPLFSRIREHFRNIKQVENLSPTDFKCRYMILDGDESRIIGPVEASLIRKFQPLWNTIIDGFGNHTPGEGRFNQAKSGWDVPHPGRTWAARCMGKPPDYDDMVKRIGAYAKLRRKS
ncbi:MAG: Eco29kI family restriction endonuclease [Syntrophobacteraceae bacterium]